MNWIALRRWRSHPAVADGPWPRPSDGSQRHSQSVGIARGTQKREEPHSPHLAHRHTELSALTWFPSFAKNMRSAYPDLRLHPEIDLSAVLLEKLLNGELDVVVIQDLYLPQELESIVIQTVQYGWFCKPGLLPTDRAVSLDEVAAYPVIEQNAGSGLTALTRRLFAGMGIDIEHVFGSNSLTALAGLVETGVGVACLPVKYFQPVRQGCMVSVRTAPAVPTATYHLAFRPDDQSTLRTRIAEIAKKCATSKPPPSAEFGSRK
nr:LysR family transcriptional regulator substrate-binding protein [Acidovorax delafieldii]